MRYTIPVAAYVLVALTSTHALPVFEDARNYNNEAADAGVELAKRCGGSQRLNGEGFVKRADLDDHDESVDFQARCSGANKYSVEAGFGKRGLSGDNDNDDGVQLAARCSRTAGLGQEGYVKRDIPDEEVEDGAEDLEQDDADDEGEIKLDTRSFDDGYKPRSYEGSFAYDPHYYRQAYEQRLRDEHRTRSGHPLKRDVPEDEAADELGDAEDEQEDFHKRAVMEAAIQTVKPSFLSGAFKTLSRPRVLVPLTGAAAGVTGYELSSARHHPYSRHNPLGFRQHHHHGQDVAGEGDQPIFVAIAEPEAAADKFEFPPQNDHGGIVFGRDVDADDNIEPFMKRGAQAEVFYDAVSTAAKPLAEEAGIIAKKHPVKAASFGNKAKTLLKNKHTKTAGKALGLGGMGAGGYALGEHHRDDAHSYVDGQSGPVDEPNVYDGEWQPLDVTPGAAAPFDDISASGAGIAQSAPAIPVMSKRSPQGAAAAETAAQAGKTILKTAEGAGAAATTAVDAATKTAGKGLLAGKKAIAAGVAAVSGTGILAYNSGKSAGYHAAELAQNNSMTASEHPDVAAAAKRAVLESSGIEKDNKTADDTSIADIVNEKRTSGWGSALDTRPIDNRSAKAEKWVEKRAEMNEKRYIGDSSLFEQWPNNRSSSTDDLVEKRAETNEKRYQGHGFEADTENRTSSADDLFAKRAANTSANDIAAEESGLKKRFDGFDIPVTFNRTAKSSPKWIAKRDEGPAETDDVDLDKRDPNAITAIAKPATKASKPFYKNKMLMSLGTAGVVGGGFALHRMHKNAAKAAVEPRQMAARGYSDDAKLDDDETEPDPDPEKRQVGEMAQGASAFFSKPAVAKSLMAAGTVGAAGTTGYLLGDNHDKIDDLYHGYVGEDFGEQNLSRRGSSFHIDDDTDAAHFTPLSQSATTPDGVSEVEQFDHRSSSPLASPHSIHKRSDKKSQGSQSSSSTTSSTTHKITMTVPKIPQTAVQYTYKGSIAPQGSGSSSGSKTSSSNSRRSLDREPEYESIDRRSGKKKKTTSSSSTTKTSTSQPKKETTHKISIKKPNIPPGANVKTTWKGSLSPSGGGGSSSSSSKSKSRRSVDVDATPDVIIDKRSSGKKKTSSSSSSSSTTKSSTSQPKKETKHYISIKKPDLPPSHTITYRWKGEQKGGSSGSGSGSSNSRRRRSLDLDEEDASSIDKRSSRPTETRTTTTERKVHAERSTKVTVNRRPPPNAIEAPPQAPADSDSSSSQQQRRSFDMKTEGRSIDKRSGNGKKKTSSSSSSAWSTTKSSQPKQETKRKITVKQGDLVPKDTVKITWLGAQKKGSSSQGSGGSSNSRRRRSLDMDGENTSPFDKRSSNPPKKETRTTEEETKSTKSRTTKITVQRQPPNALPAPPPSPASQQQERRSIDIGADVVDYFVARADPDKMTSADTTSKSDQANDKTMDATSPVYAPTVFRPRNSSVARAEPDKTTSADATSKPMQVDEKPSEVRHPVYAPSVFRPRKRNVGSTLIDAVRGGLTNTNVLAGSIGLTTLLGGSAMAGYEVGKISGERRKDIHVYHHDGAEAEKADRLRKHREQSVVGALHDFAIPA